VSAPITFVGWQDGSDIAPDLDLWNVEVPEGTATVSRATAERMGYTVPPAPCLSPSAARARAHAWHATRRSMDTAQPFATP
jgi:hypothetical protein